MVIKLEDLRVLSYQLSPDDSEFFVTLDYAPQFDGSEKWAVRRGKYCLSKTGEWIYEPLPSSRGIAFIKNCRFDSIEHALVVFEVAN